MRSAPSALVGVDSGMGVIGVRLGEASQATSAGVQGH